MLTAKKLQTPNQNRDPLFPIIFSVVVASILVVYPMSYALASWRPLYMLLVMLFWVLCQPTWCGVWFAFGLGLFSDLLLDAPLGMNAMSYILIAFFTRYFIRERRVLTFSNLWIISLFAIVAHLVIIFFAQVMIGATFSIARHWQPLLSSICFWPIMYYVLKRWRI